MTTLTRRFLAPPTKTTKKLLATVLAASMGWIGPGAALGAVGAVGAGGAELAGLAALAEPAAKGQSQPPARVSERWYVVELGGQRAGHMRSRQEVRPAKPGATSETIVTQSEMKLEIKRGAMSLPISIESTWEETADGKPISLESSAMLGALPTRKTYTFTPEGIEIATKMGEQRSASTMPRPAGDWLTPAAAERELARRLKAGEKTIVLTTLEDEPGGSLTVVKSTRTILERTTVEVFGRTAPAIKTKVAIDRYAGVESAEYIGEDGESLRSEISLGGMRMVQRLADKGLALSPVDAPELLLSTLVEPDRPIENPRRVRSGVYVLTVRDGEAPALPSTGGQVVERIDGKSVRVRVSVGEPQPAGKVGGAGEVGGDRGDGPQFLASSTMLNTADPEVAALARKALPKEIADPAQRAERLRRFVHGYIKAKDLSVGFASASEVARTKTGDCTEHGVLLAALLRAAGVPSRVASGLIYVEQFQGRRGVFGYHMWAQAWLPAGAGGGGGGGGRWVDLDATLEDDTPTDATHILLGVSALGDAESENFMLALAPLLGQLKISVEKAQP